ncbi:hypothetical protein M8330_17035 [Nocardioides sp. BSK12Z-4]|uniref:Uncharacterized protein n=1 Tax=Nocardioides bruguierae TaxID=2945102 RepID=A0A9X2IGG5_9ACTN|nr:hypothetical protein [Nocardioides bruguierae]MCM0621998.1 hypothetical protein [Nocardioides bruguierae]
MGLIEVAARAARSRNQEKGDLDGARAELVGDGQDLVEHGCALSAVGVVRVRAEPSLVAASILAGEQAAGQRGVEQDAEPVRLGHGQDLALGGALRQAVLGLDGGDESVASGPARADGGARDPPRGEVGEAPVAGLAGADEVVEPGEDLLGRGDAVGEVRHEDVDVVRPQSSQAVLQGADHDLATVPRRARRRAGVPRPRVLGDQDVVVPPVTEQSAQDLLGLAVLVEVRGVEGRAAGGHEGLEDLAGRLDAGGPGGRAEGGGAQHELRGPQAGASSEGLVAHLWWCSSVSGTVRW